jgi:hypothetical protein
MATRGPAEGRFAVSDLVGDELGEGEHDFFSRRRVTINDFTLVSMTCQVI